MNISFEAPDKVNGLMTITLEKEDYQGEVEKTLKDYRKRANIPGFRPGQVPMGMIKRQFGTSAKVDVVNKLLGEKLYGYVKENNIQMLGEPLPAEQQEPVDFEGEGALTFKFDIAVAPEFKAELTDKDKIDYYNSNVDDNLIESLLFAFATLSQLPFVIRSGKTGAHGENTELMEFRLQLDSNPEFTASVIASYARATYRMAQKGETGCKTILDIPVAYASPLSGEELRKSLL